MIRYCYRRSTSTLTRRFMTTTTTTSSSVRSTNHHPQQQQQNNERLRRCLFSVPGYVPKMIHKALSLNVDSIVLDLEDGVPLHLKDSARNLILQTLLDDTIQLGRSEICIRINGLNTGELALRDLQTLLPCLKLQTVIIPKVESSADIHFVNRYIDALCSNRNQNNDEMNNNNNNNNNNSNNNNNVRILAAIESAVGILNLRDIAESSRVIPSFDGLIFASEDYCADIEAIRTVDATELLYARSQLVTVAKAYKLQAIDMVHINFRNLTELQKECSTGKQLGFTGKQAIHPNQIEIIHAAYSPSIENIQFATTCVEQYQGIPIEINGIVVDNPVYKWAIKILHRAQAAGLTTTHDDATNES